MNKALLIFLLVIPTCFALYSQTTFYLSSKDCTGEPTGVKGTLMDFCAVPNTGDVYSLTTANETHYIVSTYSIESYHPCKDTLIDEYAFIFNTCVELGDKGSILYEAPADTYPQLNNSRTILYFPYCDPGSPIIYTASYYTNQCILDSSSSSQYLFPCNESAQVSRYYKTNDCTGDYREFPILINTTCDYIDLDASQCYI